MQCPTCPGVTLLMTIRDGIEIDYCPKCRGVWLDRGELDKLIERAAGQPSPSQAAASPQAAAPQQQRQDYRRESSGRLPAQGGYRKRSWLGDLFD